MSNSYLAPVTLFVFNRPEKTLQTLSSLKKNIFAAETLLYIFLDGPRNESDKEKIEEVRKIIYLMDGFKEIKIFESEVNQGLAKSIINGVTKILNKHGKIIVLEDDLKASPFFLKYMNESLALYENDQEVISIHGYIYPINKTLPETFFIKGADCWGWGTWKRGWDLFEKDGKTLLKKLRQKKKLKEFDFNGSFGYSKMLEDQINGKNNSWAIRWYASAFLNEKLTLYPGRSLINNIGFDGTGVHCEGSNSYAVELSFAPIEVKRIPIKEDNINRQLIEEFFRKKFPKYKKIISFLPGFLILNKLRKRFMACN